MHVLNEFMFQSHMSRLTQWSAKRFYNSLSVYSRPLPLRKNSPLAAQLKIAFRRFLFFFALLKASLIMRAARNEGVSPIEKKKYIFSRLVSIPI